MTFISRHCPEIVFEMIELLYNGVAALMLFVRRQRIKPDVIYERYFLFSIASFLFARLYGVPIVYEVNDSSFVPRLRPLVLSRLAQTVERFVLSSASCVFVVSRNFKQHLVAAGIPARRIQVTHNAIDPAIFNPDTAPDIELGLPEDRVVIGFVGLFVRWVGLDFLIDVFHEIHTRFPQAHLLLVGGGPEEGRLRDAIDAFGMEASVTITGRVDHEVVPSYLKSMDVCVIPNHETYTSPVKLFEYMAMGKAVVVPNFDSLQEIINQGLNGVLFEVNDKRALIDALSAMVDSPELSRKLGRQARSDVLNAYTWHRNAMAIVNAVDDTARHGGTGTLGCWTLGQNR